MFLDDIKNQVIGIDEVGRGAISGPVVSCSILLSERILENNLVYQINDSKMLSEKKRITIAEFIKKNSIYAIGISTNKEIDEINILNATNFEKSGDKRFVSIAAASILAKTWRDKLMIKYSKVYPMYGWQRNKGYGTAEHRKAIIKYGKTKIHRKSFLKNFL